MWLWLSHTMCPWSFQGSSGAEGGLSGVPWAVEMPMHNRAINPLMVALGSQMEDEQDQAGFRFQLNHRFLCWYGDITTYVTTLPTAPPSQGNRYPTKGQNGSRSSMKGLWDPKCSFLILMWASEWLWRWLCQGPPVMVLLWQLWAALGPTPETVQKWTVTCLCSPASAVVPGACLAAAKQRCYKLVYF